MNSAYNQLVEFYKKDFNKVYSFFFYKTGQDVTLAEDLTQSAFLRALEKLDLYNPDYPISTWFWKLTRNMLVDYYRANANKKTVALDEAKEIPQGNNIEEDVDKTLQLDKVFEHPNKLPEKKRDLVILYYIADLPANVIAEMYNTTANNIKVQISRIISKLSLNLEAHAK